MACTDMYMNSFQNDHFSNGVKSEGTNEGTVTNEKKIYVKLKGRNKIAILFPFNL